MDVHPLYRIQLLRALRQNTQPQGLVKASRLSDFQYTTGEEPPPKARVDPPRVIPIDDSTRKTSKRSSPVQEPADPAPTTVQYGVICDPPTAPKAVSGAAPNPKQHKPRGIRNAKPKQEIVFNNPVELPLPAVSDTVTLPHTRSKHVMMIPKPFRQYRRRPSLDEPAKDADDGEQYNIGITVPTKALAQPLQGQMDAPADVSSTAPPPQLTNAAQSSPVKPPPAPVASPPTGFTPQRVAKRTNGVTGSDSHESTHSSTPMGPTAVPSRANSPLQPLQPLQSAISLVDLIPTGIDTSMMKEPASRRRRTDTTPTGAFASAKRKPLVDVREPILPVPVAASGVVRVLNFSPSGGEIAASPPAPDQPSVPPPIAVLAPSPIRTDEPARPTIMPSLATVPSGSNLVLFSPPGLPKVDPAVIAPAPLRGHQTKPKSTKHVDSKPLTSKASAVGFAAPHNIIQPIGAMELAALLPAVQPDARPREPFAPIAMPPVQTVDESEKQIVMVTDLPAERLTPAPEPPPPPVMLAEPQRPLTVAPNARTVPPIEEGDEYDDDDDAKQDVASDPVEPVDVSSAAVELEPALSTVTEGGLTSEMVSPLPTNKSAPPAISDSTSTTETDPERARKQALLEQQRERLRLQRMKENAAKMKVEAQRVPQKKSMAPLMLSKRLAANAKKEALAARRRARIQAMKQAEAAREAAETAAMHKEEWDQHRAQWWGTATGGWHVVRVFISSTFNDMHGERDALTRTVFPLLNERARSRKVLVVPIDLRWGLTSEDTSDAGLGALEHCLLEIDHARPFFMVLCGERYGWIPPSYRVSDRPEFEWVKSFPPGYSITAMEIYHGMLRKPFTPVRAFVYLRDPSFMASITDANDLKVFAFDYDGNEEVLRRRDQVREDMIKHPFAVSRTYTCTYGGRDQDNKPRVESLQQFERETFQDLWAAIDQEFPEITTELDPIVAERMAHRTFIDAAAADCVGRGKVLAEVTYMLIQNWDKESLPVAITGELGTGKTSFMCALTAFFEKHEPEVLVIPHIVHATPRSSSVNDMLVRLCSELEEHYGCAWDHDDSSYQVLREGFRACMTSASCQATLLRYPVVLIIDAVNQLDATHGMVSLDWLPKTVPPYVRVCVSFESDSEAAAAFHLRTPPPPCVDLPPLADEDRQEIVRRQLEKYRKRLTGGQMASLVVKDEAFKPLFLVTCCEELRLQAQYGLGGSGVDNMIHSLPEHTSSLFDVVLARVEHHMDDFMRTPGHEQPLSAAAVDAAAAPAPPTADMVTHTSPGAALVRDVLVLLRCSRFGLREAELLQLLAPPGMTQLPHAVWARLYRNLSAYVRQFDTQEDATIRFFHPQILLAIRARYLTSSADQTAAYQRLFMYFKGKADPAGDQSWSGTNNRDFGDLIYYMTKSKRYFEMVEAIRSLHFLHARSRLGTASMEGLLHDFNLVHTTISATKFSALRNANLPYKYPLLQSIMQFQQFVNRVQSSLVACPYLTFQSAYNQPSGAAPREAAEELIRYQVTALNKLCCSAEQLAEGRKDDMAASMPCVLHHTPRWWFDWVNKPRHNRCAADFSGFASGLMVLALHPDGRRVALGFEDASLHIIDMMTGESMTEAPKAHAEGVTALTFAPDGKLLLSGSSDSEIQIWETATGILQQTVKGHSRAVTALAWLDTGLGTTVGPDSANRPMGRAFVSASMDSSIKIWEQKVGKKMATKKKVSTVGTPDVTDTQAVYEMIWVKDWLPSPILSLFYNPVGSLLVAGRQDGHVQTFDCHAPNLGLIDMCTFCAHEYGAVNAVALSPVSKLLVTGSSDNVVMLWALQESGSKIRWIPCPPLRGVGHQAGVMCVTFSPDQKRVVSGGVDHKVIVWDIATSQEVLSLWGHSDCVRSILYTRTNDQLVSVSSDRSMKVWDVSGISTEAAKSVVKYATGKSLAYVTTNAIVDESGAFARPPSAPGTSDGLHRRRGKVRPAAMHKEGLAVMDLKVTAEHGQHAAAVTAIAFASDGHRAVTGSRDKELKVWDVDTGQEVVVLLGHMHPITALELTPNSRLLASADEGGYVFVWHGVFYDHIVTMHAHEGPVTCLASGFVYPRPGYNVRGTLLMSATASGDILAWQAGTMQLWATQPSSASNKGILALKFVAGSKGELNSLSDIAQSAMFMEGPVPGSVPVVSSEAMDGTEDNELPGHINAGLAGTTARVRRATENAIPSSTPHFSRDRVFMLDAAGRICAYDARTMECIYSAEVQLPAIPVPLDPITHAPVPLATPMGARIQDGMLLAVGFSDGFVKVHDSARPHDTGGALAAFWVPGEVVSIGFGPAVKPWASRADKKPYPREPSCYGDGTGAVGSIVVGNSAGSVFVLRLMDVTQIAVEKRILEYRTYYEEYRLCLDAAAEVADDILDGGAVFLTFPNGRTATAVTAPRTLDLTVTADVALARSLLGRLGFKLDEINLEDPEDARPEFIAALGEYLKLDLRPTTTAAGAAGLPVAPSRHGSVETVSSIAMPLLARKARAGHTPVQMPPRANKRTASSMKHRGHESESDRARERAEAMLTEIEKNWNHPRSLICIFGGATGLHDLLVPNLRAIIAQGVLVAAAVAGGVVLDGGTDSGIMKMVGLGVAAHNKPIVRIIGCSPHGITRRPDDPVDPEKTDLEPHHNDFVLVPTAQWGGETSTMFCIAHVFQQHMPVVAVLANGGQISKNEIVSAVRCRIPVLVIRGTGRLANTVAQEYDRKADEGSSWSADSIADEGLREILQHGELHFHDVSQSPTEYRRTLDKLLSTQREVLLAARDAANSRRPVE